MLKNRFYLLLPVVVLALCSCASVELIAPYDATTDQDITSLQNSTIAFLTDLESNGPKLGNPSNYSAHTKFYDSTHVALTTLETRVAAISDNTQTAGEIANLSQLFDQLQQRDETKGLTKGDGKLQQPAFNRVFRALLTLEVAKKSLSDTGSGTSTSAQKTTTTN
jgi:hypothetical protein